MTRKRIALLVVWALSLIIVAAFAHAQIPPPPGNTTPTFISGNNLGFQVEHRRGDHVTGTLMVRINGAWLVAEPAGGVKPLTFK
jgi:hypothetical protein